MTTAMNPNPVPDSSTLSARPSAFVGARSPYPSVKKVSPLRYNDDPKLAASLDAPNDEPTAHCSSPYATINAAAHDANKQNNENGPNQLKKCWRPAPRKNPSAIPVQTFQEFR